MSPTGVQALANARKGITVLGPPDEALAGLCAEWGSDLIEKYSHLRGYFHTINQTADASIITDCTVSIRRLPGSAFDGAVSHRGLDLPVHLSPKAPKKHHTVMIVGQDSFRVDTDFPSNRLGTAVSIGTPFGIYSDRVCRKRTPLYWDLFTNLTLQQGIHLYLTDAKKEFWKYRNTRGRLVVRAGRPSDADQRLL